MACIRPLDAAAVMQAAFETQHLIVVEDHNTEGGLATHVADVIADLALPCTLHRIGARHYFPSGPSEQLTVLAGMDAEEIANDTEDQFALRLAGGEDVFVSCVYGLAQRLPTTRFMVSAQPMIERLRTDTAYLLSLRALWKSRAIDPKEFPTNEELTTVLLGIPPVDTLNPLTGTERGEQHDMGIL